MINCWDIFSIERIDDADSKIRWHIGIFPKFNDEVRHWAGLESRSALSHCATNATLPWHPVIKPYPLKSKVRTLPLILLMTPIHTIYPSVHESHPLISIRALAPAATDHTP